MVTQRFTVLGAGSWGTALAILLARHGNLVSLWSHQATQTAAMQQNRCNSRYLPDAIFPDNLSVCTDLAADIAASQFVLIAVPSHAFAETLERIKPHWHDKLGLVWATKGLGPKGEFLHQVARRILGRIPHAMITGPSFAKEVVANLPTAVVLAAEDIVFAEAVQQCFHTPYFRTYLCPDLIGAEIGGAVKNCLAIAVGIADGMQYGANTRAALMTRGLAEMIRLGTKLGAQKDTFSGLSGLGDLILTCTDNQSRNRRFGLYLGQGNTAEQAKTAIGQVVEGLGTTKIIYHLAEQHRLELPIIQQIYRVLHQGLPPTDAVKQLLARSVGLES